MTKDQVQSLNLGIAPITDRVVLFTEAALEWVLENTTLQFDYNKEDDLAALPAPVKIFVVKYNEIMGNDSTVASESIEGLSQSFKSTDISTLLWDCAEQLLGKWLKGTVKFVAAQRRWN